MKPTTLAYSQVSTQPDEDLSVTLIKQADALEISVRRAERKLRERTTLRADLAFSLSAVGFVLVFGLAVSPYLNLGAAVPQIISYIAAFAVLLLAYFVYLAYGNARAVHQLARATRTALEDGNSALTRAFATLDAGRVQETAPPETRARIECAIRQAEQATAGLEKLETQTRHDIDALTKAHAGPRSSVLAGLIGGFAGAACGISFVTSESAMAIMGPVGAAIGIALALLLWRGPSQWRVERATDRTEEALALYYKELNRPTKEVPDDLRDNHWGRYERLLTSYAALAERAVGGRYGSPARRPPTQLANAGKALDEATPSEPVIS